MDNASQFGIVTKKIHVQVYFSILGEHVDFYRNE